MPCPPDNFVITQSSKGKKKIYNLLYLDIDYASIPQKQLLLKKDYGDKIKMKNEVRFSCFLNHMFMHHMANTVLTKKVFEKYKKLYKDH